jgi:polysaccharide biosynthesis protein PslH
VKLLVLTSRFPYPLEKGDKLRIFHQIRELSQRHEIILCALTEEIVQDADYQQVMPFCSQIHIFHLSKMTIFLNILAGILRGLPFSVSYFFNRKIQKSILAIAEKENPNHVYCQLVRTSEYFKETPYPKTLDYMDAFSVGMRRRSEDESWILRPFYALESKLLKKYETSIFPYYNNLTIISEQDKSLMLEREVNVKVVPNGVDTDYFKPIHEQKPPPIYIFSSIRYDIAFVGNLGYYPNIQAAKYLVHQLLPLLKKHKPDIKILLAGARPSQEVELLANENVDIKRDLEDIREAYAAAQIFVAPIFHGSGQQNKILEAMAMGLPCITTTLVNNAILAKPNEEILTADTEGVFVEQILNLLQDIDYQLIIKANGRKFVKTHYSWHTATKVLNDLMENKFTLAQPN